MNKREQAKAAKVAIQLEELRRLERDYPYAAARSASEGRRMRKRIDALVRKLYPEGSNGHPR